MKALAFAEYFYRLSHGSTTRVRASACPRCGVRNATPVSWRGTEWCSKCLPATKTCSVCGRRQSMAAFNVRNEPRQGGGYWVDSHCRSCRRAYSGAQYRAAMTDGYAPVARKVCRACGRRREASSFQRDGRYVSGLEPMCKACKAEYVRAALTTRPRRPSSPKMAKSLRLQGKYIGWIGHLAARDRAAIRKVASSRGRAAAIEQMRPLFE